MNVNSTSMRHLVIRNIGPVKEAEVSEEFKLCPGMVTEVRKDSFIVATGEGFLQILELQLEGKKRMNTHDFLLGVKVMVGEVLGKRETE